MKKNKKSPSSTVVEKPLVDHGNNILGPINNAQPNQMQINTNFMNQLYVNTSHAHPNQVQPNQMQGNPNIQQQQQMQGNPNMQQQQQNQGDPNQQQQQQQNQGDPNQQQQQNQVPVIEQNKKPYMTFATEAPKNEAGVDGITFDFNYGARVQVPQGNYRVKLVDRDACLVVYDAPANGVIVTSNKKYFVNFRVEVFKDDKLIFEHNLDLKDKNVMIKFPVGILGDVLAWFPFVDEFRKKHGCNIFCALAPDLAEMFKMTYPEINFIDPDIVPEDIYASYYMGVFFPCEDRFHQPVDFRLIGLHHAAANILGLEQTETYIKLQPKDKTRKIKEPYVCIAAQSSSQAKYWNNGMGWFKVVEHLKSKGYRVLCIDREQMYGMGSRYNLIPYGAEDFTGRLPLQDRVDLLHNADFFVGLSSGLSWLANGTGIPIVLISGFTLPITEFKTPYRVINYHVCNGCWNDMRVSFSHTDFDWCPHHKGTDKHYECSRYITPDAVIKVIDRLMEDHGYDPSEYITQEWKDLQAVKEAKEKRIEEVAKEAEEAKKKKENKASKGTKATKTTKEK